MTTEAIASRATNQAGVSVGTSLALETILPLWPVFDPAREAPPKVNLHDYSRVWINLRTIARNLHNAVPSEYRDNLRPQELAQAVAEEAWVVAKAIEDGSSGATKAMIYLPKYEQLPRIFPNAKLREPSTEKQKAVDRLMKEALKLADESLDVNHRAHYRHTGVKIDPGSYGKTLMLTHMPVDLLNAHRFGNLELLESHTGLVKSKNQWYTKLFAGKALGILPFNTMTLQVMGDDHSFHPMNISVKREILDIATKNHWSWMTTDSKVRSDILKHPENQFKLEVLKLLDPL